jgi:hypothetical protein
MPAHTLTEDDAQSIYLWLTQPKAMCLTSLMAYDIFTSS